MAIWERDAEGAEGVGVAGDAVDVAAVAAVAAAVGVAAVGADAHEGFQVDAGFPKLGIRLYSWCPFSSPLVSRTLR
jgi:L-alanine-DL-glutamate epimerase-like enolase superfamily enzyme